MPRKYQKKDSFRNYDPDDMVKAVKAVKDKSLSVRAAAASYKVPKSSLFDRVSGRVQV